LFRELIDVLLSHLFTELGDLGDLIDAVNAMFEDGANGFEVSDISIDRFF